MNQLTQGVKFCLGCPWAEREWSEITCGRAGGRYVGLTNERYTEPTPAWCPLAAAGGPIKETA